MAKQVMWTEEVLEKVVKYALLSATDEFILRTRVQGMTISQQAEALGYCERTINRRIDYIKRVYDVVQKEHPDELPIRKQSAKELYMDTH